MNEREPFFNNIVNGVRREMLLYHGDEGQEAILLSVGHNLLQLNQLLRLKTRKIIFRMLWYARGWENFEKLITVSPFIRRIAYYNFTSTLGSDTSHLTMSNIINKLPPEGSWFRHCPKCPIGCAAAGLPGEAAASVSLCFAIGLSFGVYRKEFTRPKL